MFVAASTECLPELGIVEAIERFADLEYTSVEIALHEPRPAPAPAAEGQGGMSSWSGSIPWTATSTWATAGGKYLTPALVAADTERSIKLCRDTHRLTLASYSLDWPQDENYYAHFAAVCKLAKATKVVTLTVPAAELGTPFNQEIERLKQLVQIASVDGILVGLKTEVGTLTENPDTAVALCDNVKGLGITLDPSHYVCGPWNGRSYDQLLKYVVHVHLRDTKKDRFQVKVGQGEIEYGKIIASLELQKYNHALSVHITPQEDIDHHGELRKLRLLLESML
ncbi:MAG: sugar phosphate isomerase/epimerase [Pirellulales bacterium]|nr:sugar phosphate isomerase/epimerase [Pirellulales bacterium]